jgi:hypothetical protein
MIFVGLAWPSSISATLSAVSDSQTLAISAIGQIPTWRDATFLIFECSNGQTILAGSLAVNDVASQRCTMRSTSSR